MTDRDSLSLYLHVPFCRSKCTYCAFNTYVRLEHLIEPFVAALQAELRCCAVGAAGSVVHSLFFGGGTPSLLRPRQVAEILRTIRAGYCVAGDAEISLEANPNDLDEAWLGEVRAAGVNRLSVGVQSTHARELRLFARRHDSDQVAGAVAAARRAGFDNISLDLIYGIPEQGLSDWEHTLQQVLLLRPAHLSLYALSLEAGTPLREWVERGQVAAPDDDLAAAQYELAGELLAERGYRQYEISNWSLPGHECRHNLQYWRNLAWLGLGPGAHGHAAGLRTRTLLSPQRYIEVCQSDGGAYCFPLTPATDIATRLTRRDEIGDTLIMGLRLTREGIERAAFRERFGVDLQELHGDALRRHVGNGLLEIDGDRVRLSPSGRLLANLVLRDLV